MHTTQKCYKYIKERNSSDVRNSSAIAIIDGKREYSYRLMFRRWSLYAEVFSALGITGRKGARAGLTGLPSAETIFAFYALNMTGTSVSMMHIVDLNDPDNFKAMVEKEGITDLILADSAIHPQILDRILTLRYDLGIRNIIILDIPICGRYISEQYQAAHRKKIKEFRQFRGVLFMKDLFEKYEATSISYAEDASDEAAVILHTSGTTRGIHKPIPLSDTGLNEAVERLITDDRFSFLEGRAVTYLAMDLSSSYAMVDILHLTLAFGGTIVTLPATKTISGITQVIDDYGINVIFASGALFESLIRSKEALDLSRLAFVFLGGTYVPAHAKKRYDAFLKKKGAKIRTSIGYGLSETAAACILASSDRKDDAMGYPLAGVDVKIYVEEENRYYNLEDGPGSGVLCLSSPSLSCGRIGDTVFFDLIDIDGRSYLNTYDRVNVNADGSLTYAGRMNKYFVNNEGIRFDAGLVETAIAAVPDMTDCSLAPGYDKSIHDTIPVLFVPLKNNEEGTVKKVRQALIKVFIQDDKISKTNLPGQCVIAETIPHDAMGKVDTYQMMKRGVKGSTYRILPVRKQVEGKTVLSDIRLIKAYDAPGRRAGIPMELEDDFRRRVIETVNDYTYRNKKTDMRRFDGMGSDQMPEEELRAMGCDRMPEEEELRAMGCDRMPEEEELRAMGCDRIQADVRRRESKSDGERPDIRKR